MHHFEQIFFRNYLLKMFCLENLKNLNTFPRKSSMFMPLKRKNMSLHKKWSFLRICSHYRCNHSLFRVNKSEKRLWLALVFSINIGKIIVPKISLPIKDKKNVKLLKKYKNNFYNNLNVKWITDNRIFWQTIKPNITE